jgi:hypothetical protein
MRTFTISTDTTPLEEWPNQPERAAAKSMNCERLFKWAHVITSYDLPRYVADTCFQAGYEIVVVVRYYAGERTGTVLGLRRAK